MSRRRRGSSVRAKYRGAGCQVRRLEIESLERRDCPAVQAFLAGGVLSVVGDEQNNVIEILQTPDGVVQVFGDEQTWVFEGLDGATLDVNAAAGDDRVSIKGGQADESGTGISPILKYLASDPGGDDVLLVDVAVIDNVSLDVDFKDGSDTVDVDLQRGAVNSVRAAFAGAHIELGGAGNRIAVNTTDIDQVEFDLAAAGGGNTAHGGFGWTDPYMVEDHPPYCAISLDFGGGGNLVDLNTQGFDQADLELRAAGGNNVVKHELGHTLGFRHEHTRPEARIDMDFAGGGNSVEVRMENVEDVDLSIASEPTTPEPATGGTINVYWHVINNSSGTVNVGRDDGTLQMVSLSAGNPLALGVSPTSFSFTATAGGTNPSSANLALTTGSDDDTLSIQTLNVGDLDLALDLGEGQDTVAIDAKVVDADGRIIPGSDVNVLTENVEHVKSELALPGGDNNVAIAALLPETADGDDSTLEIGLALGGGGNDVNVRTQNMDGVVLLYSSLPGGASTGNGGMITLVAGTTLTPAGRGAGVNGGSVTLVAYSGSAAQGSLALNLTTGDGPDIVDVGVTDFADVSLNLDTGGGDDDVRLKFITAETGPASGNSRLFVGNLSLDSGDDNVNIETTGFSGVDLGLNAGTGNDTAIVDGMSNTLLVGERPPCRMNIDLGAGNDNLDVQTTDLGNFELDLTAGDGNDTINASDQGPTLVASRVHYSWNLGDGDDRLTTEVVDHAFVTSFVDAGVGDDEVEVHAQAGTPAVLLHRFSSNMVVDLGDGNNKLLVETTAFAEVTQDFRSGSGNDQISIADRAGPYFQFESKRLRQQVHSGGGDDIVLDDIAGSDDVQAAIDTGSGNDALFARYGIFAHDSRLIIDLSLGAGSDVVLLDAVGYSQIAATFDTGPAGDGRDLVMASFRLTPFDRLRRIRRSVDSGQDLFELFVSTGYDVQMTAGNQCLIVIMTR